MLKQDRYCFDILTQLHAARAAPREVASEFVKGHLKPCVAGAMASGDEAERGQKTAELVELINKLRK